MLVASPYSPFFNSGLLASADNLNCGHVMVATPGSRHHKRSRSVDTGTSSSNPRSNYLSLQRRDHSFLSLDLAQSRLSDLHHPQIKPSYQPPSVSPLLSHFSSACSLRSAASLRSMPSPKPAPSIMLPKIPDPPPPPYSKRQNPPKLPELPVLSALQFPLPPNYFPQSKLPSRPLPQRPLPSPPSPSPSPFSNPPTALFSPFSPSDDDNLTPPPRSSVLTKPRHLRSKKPKDLDIVKSNRFSKASFSTVSTRVRRRNRWDALDTLEGRRKPSPADSPYVPPPQNEKRSLKVDNAFIKPTTFARANPLPLKSTSTKPNFMNMSDDSDPEPESGFHSSFSYSTASDYGSDLDLDVKLTLGADIYLNPNGTRDPLFDSEEIDAEEGVVLEATRCPAPQSPPAVGPVPVPQPQPSTTPATSPPTTPVQPVPPATTQPQANAFPLSLRVKRPVVRARNGARALPSAGSAAPAFVTAPTTRSRETGEKEDVPTRVRETLTTGTAVVKKEQEIRLTSRSKYRHPHSSSRRHKHSGSTSANTNARMHARNNKDHYRSFIELDVDDNLEGEAEVEETASSVRCGGAAPAEGVGKEECQPELFAWKGRMGRGIAEGRGDWVWV